jgi:hypothetical protein
MCTGGPCRYWLPQIHERGAKKESQIHGRASLCRRLGGQYLAYESAPDSTPCPDHVERLRSAYPWSTAVGRR